MDHQIKNLNGGIFVQTHSNKKILLDPRKVTGSDFIFVSHAHTDHLHKKKKNEKIKIKTLASKETSIIAKIRGYDIQNTIDTYEGFELVDTGHILGSRGLLIYDEIFYTGDISVRKRGFMNSTTNIPKVDTLIIESTFGKPEYVFPSISKIIDQTNKIISECYDKGNPVLIMGYSVGKAQLLFDLFKHWDPFYVHDSIYAINKIYSELGIILKNSINHTFAEENNLLSKNNPWIMLSPLMNGNSKFVKHMKEKYGVVTIGFSGWSIQPGYKYMMNLDHTMTLSDHCDYNELIHVVKRSNAKKVYTIHGFADEFADSLRKMGFNAESLEK